MSLAYGIALCCATYLVIGLFAGGLFAILYDADDRSPVERIVVGLVVLLWPIVLALLFIPTLLGALAGWMVRRATRS